jgi:Family of unknown function (DUF5832)
MSSTNDLQFKTNQDGTENKNYVDLCDEDPIISGQKFVCVSFISPESILKKRELYLFNQFVKQWDMSKSMSKFNNFLSFLSVKYNLNSENLTTDYDEFIKVEEAMIKESSQVVDDDYKNFLDKNEDRLNGVFDKRNNFQTSVRGLKVRGSFPTQDEAEANCKKLRQNDPSHDIYVAPCGVWLPWEPTYYKLGKVDYLEPELNRLHEEKIKNEIEAKNEFDKRIKDAKRKAIEANIESARKSGNKLTQTLDTDGNLVGVNTMNFDDREVSTHKGREEHESQLLGKLENN